MIYKSDYGPNGLRLWTDPTVRIFLDAFTFGALFVLWYDFEPLLTFRPVDAVVAGSDQSEVFYRYVVAGTAYMGRKYSRIDLEKAASLPELRAAAYERGSKVQAWYNPLQAEEAVLSREPNAGVLVLASLSLLMLWLGCSRRMLRAEPPAPQSPSAPIE